MTINLFYETLFNPSIAYGATGGPEFSTDIITNSSNFEYRNINWLCSRNKYNLAPAIKTKEQLEYLIAFFRNVQGKAIGFRFKDWIDYEIKDQVIAVSNGKQTEFQLIKTYFNFKRKIIKPVQGSVRVFLKEEECYPEIDYTTGMIRFLEAPQEGLIIKVTGEFDVPVRFDTDHLVTSIENYGAYSNYDIPLIEIKL